MKKIQIILLLIVMLGGFTARFYKFNGPVADWMSWRQADTAAVTRNFVKEGFSPFYPKFDVENSLNEGQIPNPHRYFFAEFPVYNILTYLGYTRFGYFTIEEWGRLVTIFFSTLSVAALYFLVSLYSNRRIAFLAAFIFAFLPYNIYYGRVILPDPMYIFFSVLSLYLTTLWVRKNKIYWSIFTGISFGMSILLKPYSLVLFLPIAYIVLSQWKFKAFIKPGNYLLVIIGIVPYLLWKHHIDMYPEGQFATLWLYNAGDIRFTGAYFRWLIFDRMNRLIFATGGFVLFWLGIITNDTKKSDAFYYMWLVSILIFFVVIAKGNVTHDYYQMPLVPIGCIFIAIGLDFILSFGKSWYQKGINYLAAVSLLLLMFAFGWYEVRGYFNINHPEIVAAGKAADALLPKNALVITPYQNDSAFLYQTNRYGWTVGGGKIPNWIKLGAGYLVSVNYDESTDYWVSHCSVVVKTSSYVIVNLGKCKNINPSYASTLSGV